MDLSEDLRMSLLHFNFVMVYTIHKVLVLLKSHLNYLKDNIFKCFLFKGIIDFYLFLQKKIILFKTYDDKSKEYN